MRKCDNATHKKVVETILADVQECNWTSWANKSVLKYSEESKYILVGFGVQNRFTASQVQTKVRSSISTVQV